MNFKGTHCGIWGFGIVGKSALNYLARQGAIVSVFDKRPLNDQEYALIECNATYYKPDEFDRFVENQDYILPSPGIDVRAYKHLPLLAELDILSSRFNKPIIGITGTLGKTTTTQLLSHILESHSLCIATAGNIGIGMLDLIGQDVRFDLAVLELSSFQLELCTSFAPTISLWTNFYPNHLDRHTTLEEYFDAKQKIIALQQPGSYAVIPYEIIDMITVNHQGTRLFFTQKTLAELDMKKFLPRDIVFCIQDNHLIKYAHSTSQQLMHVQNLPHITFMSNEIALAAVLHALNIPLDLLTHARTTFKLQEHRLEKITHNGIDYYNDSKATISQATLAAVEKLQGKPIILLLGGLSKGVDRTSFLPLFKDKVMHIICFGQEAVPLSQAALHAGIQSSAFSTLEQAFQHARTLAQPGNQVLFSPAGSSFDLFKNYQERGTAFKNLISSY